MKTPNEFELKFLARLQTADELQTKIKEALRHLDHAPLQHRNGPIYQAAGVLREAIGLPPSEIGARFSDGIDK